MSRRGLSLVEVVIALGLLVTGVLFLLPMMQYALRYSQEVEKSKLAAQLAEAELERLRSWAARPTAAGFQFDELDSYPSATSANPERPDFLVSVAVAPITLYSPNSLLEGVCPSDNRRMLQNSARKVRVTVSWPSFGRRAQLHIASLIAAPTRRFRAHQPIEVVGVVPGPPLAKNATLDFQVRAFDENNREIDDLFYDWSVERTSGGGTISFLSRDGRRATFQNRSRTALGGAYYTGGNCRVKAIARYRGEEKCGYSSPIALQR